MDGSLSKQETLNSSDYKRRL